MFHEKLSGKKETILISYKDVKCKSNKVNRNINTNREVLSHGCYRKLERPEQQKDVMPHIYFLKSSTIEAVEDQNCILRMYEKITDLPVKPIMDLMRKGKKSI